MSFSIQTSDHDRHTIPPERRQSGVRVEDLVAQVADLYMGKIFKRVTERDSYPLSGVVPIQFREAFKKDEVTQKNPEGSGGKNQFEIFGVHEIFEKYLKGKEKRIQLLIQGPAGCGKSTLMRQLAALWQKIRFGEESQTETGKKLRLGFDRYKLVVRIPLNELGGEYPIHWEEYLFEQLDFDDREGFSVTLRSLLRERRVLFLLDDYNTAVDTIDFRATGIKDVLRTQHWMITSRPDCYREEKGDEIERFEMVGFSSESILAYIRSYFSGAEEAESLIEFISKSSNLEELTKIPLLLEILCFNWRENKERVFANATTTSMFQFFVLNILQKYLEGSLGKRGRYFTSLDLLLSDRTITHRDLGTAISIFVETMERMAFLHLASDKKKYSFRRDDPDLIDLVSAVLRNANLAGVSPVEAPAVLDILFDRLGLLKGVQSERGEFLHASLQEYFAGRYLAKCIQNSLEVCPGQPWRSWVDENKFNRDLDHVFRFAAGELDLKEDAESLNGLFSQILSEQCKSLFRTHENILSARCLEEVRHVTLRIRAEVIESLIDRFYFEDNDAALYLLGSPLVIGNERYEETLCSQYDGTMEDTIRTFFRSHRPIRKRIEKNVIDRLRKELTLFSNGGSLVKLHESEVVRYLSGVGHMQLQNATIHKMLIDALLDTKLSGPIRHEAFRSLRNIPVTSPEAEEAFFQVLVDDLCPPIIQVETAMVLWWRETTRTRLLDLMRKNLLNLLVLGGLIEVLVVEKPISQELLSLLKDLLRNEEQMVRFYSARTLCERCPEMYQADEELQRVCREAEKARQESAEAFTPATVWIGGQEVLWPSDSGSQEDILIQILVSDIDSHRDSAFEMVKTSKPFSEKIVNALVNCLHSKQTDKKFRKALVKLLGEIEPPRANISEALYRSLSDTSFEVRRRAIKGILRHYTVKREVAHAIVSIFRLGKNQKLTKMLQDHLVKLSEVTPLLLEALKREEIQLASIEDFLQECSNKEILDWLESGKITGSLFNTLMGLRIMESRPFIFRTQKFVHLEKDGIWQKDSLEESGDIYEGLSRIAQQSLVRRFIAANERENYKESFYALRMALEMGAEGAHFQLAELYIEGQGVEKDIEKGIHHLKMAADTGVEGAQFQLANFYVNGLGVKKDIEKAIYQYKLAADAGNSDAAEALGLIFDFGRDTERDVLQAVKYYEIAADKGKVVAQGNLAELYQFEEEVRDLVKAFACYRGAAEKESVDAMFGLGYCYEVGAGTSVDPEEANKWYTEAISLGLLEMWEEGRLRYDQPEKVEVLNRLKSQPRPTRSVEDVKVEATEHPSKEANYPEMKEGESAIDFARRAVPGGEKMDVPLLAWILSVQGRSKEAILVCEEEIGRYLLELIDETYPDLVKLQRVKGYLDKGVFGWLTVLADFYQHQSIYPKRTFSLFYLAALSEQADAIFGLGFCYEFGWGTPKNGQMAKQFYNRAIELGLLKRWKENRLVYQNPEKVEVLRRLELEQSQKLLDLQEADEVPAESSEDEGEKYYMKACELEFRENADLQRALNFYQLAAERGHAGAIERLKSRDEGLVEGLHAESTEDEGEKYYMKACELEFGDNPDLESALNFYKLAADEGHEDAIKRLSQLEAGELDE